MGIKSLLTSTGMRLAVATAVISGATLGSQTFNDDSLSFERQITAIAPVYTPSSASIPNQPSFASRSTSPNTAISVVAHSMPGSVSGAGVSAVSSPKSLFSGGGSAAGIYVSTPSSAGGGGGSAAGGGAGGGSSVGSMGAASLAMATSSFSTSAASAMRAPSGPKSLSPLGDNLVYEGDKPGIITGWENQNLDNTLIDNYGQPIGDAVLPLMILAMLFGWYGGRKRKLKEVRGS